MRHLRDLGDVLGGHAGGGDEQAVDELIAYRYEGFWTALDTLKDLQSLESLHDTGHPPGPLDHADPHRPAP